jgi:quinol monooxygenase YgiN
MTFVETQIAAFIEVFDSSKAQIRAFEGCHHLTLLRDADQANVLITYSYWQNAQSLENYRASELFRTTWAKTKVLFAAKPVAFSATKLETIET